MRWPLTWSKRHLGDQLGPHGDPLQLAARVPAARVAAAALAGLVGSEERRQLALLLGAEAGGVADHLQLAVVVVEAEDQRAERALLLAGAPADDTVSIVRTRFTFTIPVRSPGR